MPATLKLDTRAFEKTMREYVKVSRKTAADALNSKMGDVALRAIALTPRANAAKMDALLKKAGSTRGVTLPSGRVSTSKRAGMTTFDASGYVFAVLSYYVKHNKMPSFAYGVMPKHLLGLGKVTMAAARAYVNAKKRSIAYIAVGFVMAAKFFGKRITTKVSPAGWSGSSTGVKATPENLTAKIMNFSRGADKAPGVKKALNQALKDVTKDMKKYLSKKLDDAYMRLNVS